MTSDEEDRDRRMTCRTGGGEERQWKRRAGTERGKGSRGVYPPTTMALSPQSHVYSPLLSPRFPPPHPKQFLNIIYTILCNFYRVFSEFWKLTVRDETR